MVHLITGYAGEEHIQSKDQAAFNAAFIGGGEYVMQTGSEFAASITSNSTVRVLDGDILMQGRHIRVDSNEYEDLTITTGSAGTFRNDLLVMTYEKDSGTGIERAYLEVIKGDEVESNPVDPMYEQGDILNGALKNQMPLYRVIMQGVVLFKLEKIAEHTSSFKSLVEKYKSEFVEACSTHLNSLDVLDSLDEVKNNSQANNLVGGLAVKELFRSVSDGKSLVASAVTDKGVHTEEGATFDEIANNVKLISALPVMVNKERNRMEISTGNHNVIVQDTISDGKNHLFVGFAGVLQLNSYYDGLNTELLIGEVNCGNEVKSEDNYAGTVFTQIAARYHYEPNLDSNVKFLGKGSTYKTYTMYTWGNYFDFIVDKEPTLIKAVATKVLAKKTYAASSNSISHTIVEDGKYVVLSSYAIGASGTVNKTSDDFKINNVANKETAEYINTYGSGRQWCTKYYVGDLKKDDCVQHTTGFFLNGENVYLSTARSLVIYKL